VDEECSGIVFPFIPQIISVVVDPGDWQAGVMRYSIILLMSFNALHPYALRV